MFLAKILYDGSVSWAISIGGTGAEASTDIVLSPNEEIVI